MSLRKSFTAAAVAAAMIAVPTVVHAADASAVSKLSVTSAVQKNVRAGAAKRDANQIGGSLLIAALAAAAVVAGIIVVADGSKSP